MEMIKKSQRGFTLVELAIVLVIVGLIVSAVLVGQDLIENAQVRSTVTQYNEFNAAVATFRGKYNSIPGDSIGNRYGLRDGNDNIIGGNGNGIIEGAALDPDSSDELDGENTFFWAHMGTNNAAMIPGNYVGVATANSLIEDVIPRTKLAGYWTAFSVAGVNYYGIYNITADDAATNTAALTPLMAMQMDEKIDDSRATSGLIIARGALATGAGSMNADATYTGSTGNTEMLVPNSAALLAACVHGDDINDNTAIYYSANDSQRVCNLRFQMPF